LKSLEIGGDWTSPRIVHVDSVAFLGDLPDLERLASIDCDQQERDRVKVTTENLAPG